MAAVELRHADLAMYADPSDRVVLTRLSGMSRRRSLSGVTVQFEGDSDPVPFRGQSRSRSYELTVAFGVHEHLAMVNLLSLLERAQDAADSRLLLRTHIGAVPGLDPVAVVVVFGATETPLGGRGWQVALTAEQVKG